MERQIGFEGLNSEAWQSQLKANFKGKIFIGTFREKRLCDQLKSYRDVVYVEKRSEKEFSNDLESFLLEAQLSRQVFAGVVKGDDENYTIWTELDDATAFGKYWFQVNDN